MQIENLSVRFYTEDGVARAVRGVDMAIQTGETVALVGESGCGKSVTALGVMRLVPMPPGKFESGRILYKGRDLLTIPEAEMQSLRGNEIGMVFQEPMTSLNPIFTVGDQIAETIILHQKKSAGAARELTLQMLRKVAIPSPERRIDQYPHELSGGMKQRVMIAMAISCRPSLLIADEPTTALDVTIQAQILDLLETLRADTGMSILLITHNLGIVAEYAHRVAVMYSGKIIEEAPTAELFKNPAHPYTQGLLRSLPHGEAGRPLESIPGTVPNPVRLPEGCAFHPRCPKAIPQCRENIPPLVALPDAFPEHRAACLLYKSPVAVRKNP